MTLIDGKVAANYDAEILPASLDKMTGICTIDTRGIKSLKFQQLMIKHNKESLGKFRHLIWAVYPVNSLENSAFQEFEVR